MSNEELSNEIKKINEKLNLLLYTMDTEQKNKTDENLISLNTVSEILKIPYHTLYMRIRSGNFYATCSL